MTFDGIVGCCLAGAIALVIWGIHSSAPPPSIDGTVPIPHTTAQLVPWSDPTDATDIINVVDDTTGNPVARYLRGRDGVLRRAKDQPVLPAGDHPIRLTDTPVVAIGQRGGSLGAFTAYFNGTLKHGHREQIGLHYEPLGFFGDVIHAPSLALSTDLIGIGLTANLPPDQFPALSHFGIGAWEAAPFDGSHPALMYGAELHFPLP